jgi:pimeloyl-ACP methyl ester carboxylesterase
LKRSSEDLLRYYTDFSIPHDKFIVETVDGVLISGIHINTGHQKLVIVCHGGSRSKNILGNVMLCEWLSDKLDVITFDARGHNESKGILSADGKTAYDLKAVIEYAKKFNYEKIGIVGRSLGGWTSIIYAAQYHDDIDSIVAAGVPLRNPYQGTLITHLNKWQLMFMKFLTKLLLGLRFSEKWNGIAPFSEIAKVSPIPILLIYYENDPTAAVTLKDIQAFYSKARHPKQLIILKGTGHVLESKNLHFYYESIVNWFDKTLK